MTAHLERACELLWQAGHPAIAEALAAEVEAELVAAAGREQRLRDALPSLISFALGPPTNDASVRARDGAVARARAVLEEGQQP